jgi:hypothetical protein
MKLHDLIQTKSDLSIMLKTFLRDKVTLVENAEYSIRKSPSWKRPNILSTNIVRR